jgi:hypothetical protein
MAPDVRVPEAPSEQAKCKVAISQSAPLVTEWPASEKSRLESLTMQGGVVVAYSGCELRILDRCSLGGSYVYQRTTLSTDTIEIADEDELFAKLPLGAATLEGELARSGRLAIRTTVVGQLRLTEGAAKPQGVCAGASHVIGGVAVGAFKLLSGGSSSGGGSVGVAVVGEAGGKSTRREQTVREAGNPTACAEATDEGAPVDCRSPIQVFLTPLESAEPAEPTADVSARPADERPSSDSVRVAFASHDSSDRWRLHDGNGSLLCELPCARWVPKESNYELRLESGDGIKKVSLPDLHYSPDRQVAATLQPGRGSKALGIVATSVGGAALFAGLVWMLIEGVRADDPNLLAPAIFTGVGGVALGGGIAFTIYSRKANWLDVKVSTAPETRSGPATVRLRLSPGRVTGNF